MNKKGIFSTVAFGSVALFMSCSFKAEKAGKSPNVIIIYGDDVGLGDIGVYGSKMIPTPNIDKLANEGIRFNDGHCVAATCTPSRFSLLTGVHAFRHNISILLPNMPLVMPTDILTLPKLFKQAGYNTGIIGKWHLGLGEHGTPTDWNGDVKPGPIEIGFDKSFLMPSTNDRVPCVYLDGYRVLNLDKNDPLYVGKTFDEVNIPGSTLYPDGKKDRSAMTYYQSTHGHDQSVINGIGRIGYMSGGKSALWDDETMTDVFIDQTRQFITENKEKPFFLFFASQLSHVPRTPNKRFQGKTELTYRGDATVEFDWAVGEIMKMLEENGLAENTIIIFSSDNGPVYDDGYDDGTTIKLSNGEVDRGHDGSGQWSGGKYQIFEGGTRVPFIIRWPAGIKKPGVSNALVSQIDFLASFASLLNIELSPDEAKDSRDMLDAFIGKDSEGLPNMVEEAGKTLALRSGYWKYIEPPQNNDRRPIQGGDKAALYNLAIDTAETNNIIDDYPEKAAEMDKMLSEIRNGKSLR
jgi:arylsulfatase A